MQKQNFPLLLIFFIAFLLSGKSVIAQNCNGSNSAFKSGEEIKYIVSYDWFILWTEVGEITLSVKEVKYKDVPAYQYTGIGETFKSWDWIFKVRDKFVSIVEKSSLKPMYAGRDIREGNYKQLEKTWFYFNDTLSYTEKTTNDQPTTKDTVPVTPCSFDIISALYYARNLDFDTKSIGDTIPIDIILDQELYPISFRYLGVENIKVKNIGEFECVKFSVMLIEGQTFGEGGDMIVWATNDENRIPVYAESPIMVGSVKVRLSNVKGNRYPIKAYKE